MPLPEGISASRSATSSANMRSNSRNVKLPFLSITAGVYLPLHLPIAEMWNHHSLPLYATTGGIRSASRYATSSAKMSSNSRNVKLPFLTISEGGRSVTSSANMSSYSRNVKLPFFTTVCHYQGGYLPVDLSLHLPVWALTVEMWNCHSLPLYATTRGYICQ